MVAGTVSPEIRNAMTVDVVVVAAGKGRRLGRDLPKAFVELRGETLIVRALRDAVAVDPRRVVVVLPAADFERWDRRLRALGSPLPTSSVPGGATRQESVRLGLQDLRDGGDPSAPEIVAVHDAARPFAGESLWRRVVVAAADVGAAVPVVPITDCVKMIREDGRIDRTLDRARLRRVQTPQAFRFEWLWEAHRAGSSGTAPDDSALVEALGHPVATVPGDRGNVKITFPEDLEMAFRSEQGPGGTLRVGYGFDVHPLVTGRRFVLGGVEIDSEVGPSGHSDGDALAHAVGDALLGAAALGDIGTHFPPDDPDWEGADSMELLERIVARLAEAGHRPGNVDATVVVERPRLNPHLEEMGQRIAGVLGISGDAVSVKATRMEGIGGLGRGEGIAVHAVAAVARRRPDGPERR